MIKIFKYYHSFDSRRMSSLVDAMQDLLEALDDGEIPNRKDYSLGNLKTYLASLVRRQRKSLSGIKPGSWAVHEGNFEMASDARVDFIFRPTYIATATLSRCLFEYPLTALSLRGYRRALKTGLLFCSYRDLRGHGYRSDSGIIDAFRILSLGKVPLLLRRHPDFCPELKSVIDSVARDMEKRLSTGSTVGIWGEDYSEKFRSAIETFHLLDDPDFMRSFREGKKDGRTFAKEELPW